MEKLTPSYLESQIAGERYLQSLDTAAVPGTLTICILTMRNGLHIVGKSACLNPADFDAEMGRNIARADAVNQLWQLEGYARASAVPLEAEIRGYAAEYTKLSKEKNRLFNALLEAKATSRTVVIKPNYIVAPQDVNVEWHIDPKRVKGL